MTRHEIILQIQDISGESFILHKEETLQLRVADFSKNDFYNQIDHLLHSFPLLFLPVLPLFLCNLKTKFTNQTHAHLFVSNEQ